MFRRVMLLPWLTLFLFIQFPQHSETKPLCNPSSCGTITNITYPFRLKTDPKHCGERRYELLCENNQTVLYFHSQKHYVQSINYHNFTIRLVDSTLQKQNCSSLPRNSLSRFDFGPENPYSVYNYKWQKSEIFPPISKPVIFISCPYRLNPSHPLFVEIPSPSCVGDLGSFGQFNYVNFGGLNASNVRDRCGINLITATSLQLPLPATFAEIRSAMEYGFEVSWFKVLCGNNCRE